MSVFNVDLSVLGGCLSTAQRLAVKNALYRLQINERLQDVRFWGKVHGTQQDYIIACNTRTDTNVTKTFYWSVDNGATFAAFPALDAFIVRLAPLIRGLFTGNPALKHADPSKPVKLNEDGQPEEEEEQQEDETEAAEGDGSASRRPPERKLTEEERLAFTVRAIDDDCCIAPVGQSFLSPTGVVTAEPAFTGLPPPLLPSLSQWGHYRDPVTAEAKARIRKAAPSNCYDWMDAVLPELEAAPASDWAVQVAEAGLTVRLRSLQWLGWEVTAQAGGGWQGGYFGYGERNEELHFML